MTQEKANEPSVERHEYRGYQIEILTQEGQEQLWIDGERQKLLKTEKGYVLGFSSPSPTVLQAAKNYLEKFPEKD